MKSIDELLEEVAKNVAHAPVQNTSVNAPKAVMPKTVAQRAVMQKQITQTPVMQKPAAQRAVMQKQITQKPAESKPIAMPFYDRLTLSLAKEIAYAVEKAAESMGLNVVIAIDDEGANLTLLHSMDGAYIASSKIARDKAYTAVSLKMTTAAALKESRGGALDGLTSGNGITLLGGGEPLRAGGKIFGGIGVSGGTKEQDMMLAHLGAVYFEHRIKL